MTLFSSLLLVFAALDCDVGKFRLFTPPQGAQTNGTIAAKDVPGALPYANSTKRLNAGVCAATYGLREAQVMRKIFPLAAGSLAQWDKLQDAMPDLTAFDLCPTNVPSDKEYEDPIYRYMVTAKGERAISYENAVLGSVWNGNGGTWTGSNHVAKTGAYDLMTPPASNRVFRTPRITSYLKAVIDMPIEALKSGTWQRIGIYDSDAGGCWLDPTIDHASLVTGEWCEDDSTGMVADYPHFLKSLAEYRNDVDATQDVTRASAAFGGDRVWESFCTGTSADSTMESCGFPRAHDKFESAKGRRESGKISDMIAKAAPGLKESITGDWQKAVQKMTASETTRLWWERQALANGIVALQTQMFMPLGCYTYFNPTEDLSGALPESRLNEIQGKELVISGDMGKKEYYEIPTDAINISYRKEDGNPYKMHYAFVDTSMLAVTNMVATNNWHEEEADFRGSETHVAYWEHTGNAFGAGLYVVRLITPNDFETCLPQAETTALELETLEKGSEMRISLDNFELRKEIVENLSTGIPEARYDIYTVKDLPSPYGNVCIQQLYVPGTGWTGYGLASFTATGEGRRYWTSDAPATWKPLTEEVVSGKATQNPIALVEEESPLADMVKADMLVYEDAVAGTNCYSEAKRFKDDEDGKKNAWIYSRLSKPYGDVVPTLDAMKDVSQYAHGAFPCRTRMGDVLAKLPDSDAGDPFNWSEMKAEAMNLAKDVKEVFPSTRPLPSELTGVIPWQRGERGEYGAFYLLTRDKDTGLYSARWAADGPLPGLVTIKCGATDQCSRPLKHSKWIEHYSRAGMILKFDFPMMNSNEELKGGSP